MEVIPPECHADASTPCSAPDWVRCAVCARMVCRLHHELIEVLYSGSHPTGADKLCTDCIAALWDNGEILMRERYQYINRR